MSANEKSCIGLNPNTYSHLTEHLAPLCVIMKMPLLLTDEKHAAEAERLYPKLQIVLKDWQEVTPQYLIENYDVFFQSEPWNRLEFYAKFQGLEEIYQKEVRNVHCPHGFSDKVFWLEKCVWEDIVLIYGNNMIDLFKGLGIDHLLNAFVKTGNYRYGYYLSHQSHFDNLAEDRVWSRFKKKQPTILYAPTCHDPEHTTSFMSSESLFEQLPANYNLLVKIHPALEETDGPALYHMLGKYEKKDNIVFLEDFPPIYPLLARSDIYVGDMSSIGYDFLKFNRPMFFLNQRKRDVKTDRNTFLYRCGFEIRPENYANFYQIMEKELPFDQERYGKVRSEIYDYTFGDSVPFDRLRQRILQAADAPKKY
ncbi:MAG: CDP-glycerol glycerophosphotransferase family protein [Candidatus Protochlamydia sp.]|nr:CDP-glycerol glycerophosphotransferase family protein [Candidatus Protochlamydia sp.]